MAVSEQRLNGARDYRARIDVWFSGVQDWGANTSRFDWRVELIDAQRWGSWTNDRCEVWVSIGGTRYYGTFTMPSNTAGQNRVVISGETWHAHDGEGWRPGFASDAYIKVPHSNVGEGGSGQAWVDAPRIPKEPGRPNPPGFANVTTNNIQVHSGIPDNRGAGIEGYAFEWAHDAGMQTGYGYAEHNGHILDIGPMAAGKEYFFRTRARNSRGWGPFSEIRSVKTKAALYFIDPATDATETVELYAWNGSDYVQVELLIDPDMTGNFVPPVS